MSEIKVGDMVMVVRPNGCNKCVQKSLGLPRIVAKIGPTRDQWFCAGCKSDVSRAIGYDTGIICDNGVTYSSRRLIRIDPPAIPESVTTDETITA